MNEPKLSSWSWSSDGMWLRDSTGDLVLSYTNRDDGLHGDPDAKALIAAAPDILEALRKLVAEVGGLRPFEGELRAEIGNTNWSVLMLRLSEAVALIAKSEGRS